MDQKTFSVVTGAIFAIVALVHLLRILTGLARRNRRLDSADVGELDWSRSRRTPELFGIAPRYASLVD